MSMETAIQTFTLSKLVVEYLGGIRIPMIQRDYAQGRPSWANPRKRFLLDLEKALCGKKMLHLDFVYGVKQEEDGGIAFCPLDGQQRLTTLFLLHWYLAARDGRFDEFQKGFRTAAGDSLFSYQVRPGGRSFFRSLVNYAPESGESGRTEPSAWMAEQPWFRTVWMRDPTVSGALTMLDAIHEVFQDSKAGYHQLVNEGRITFQRFDLNEAGLHDDLYLRMNARGRPLSTFETFKARYEKHLESSFPDPSALFRCTVRTAGKFFDNIDTKWLDFIWERYGPKIVQPVDNNKSNDTRSVDAAFINLFRAVALASLPSKKKGTEKEDASVTSLSQGEPDYDDFEKGGWLGQQFTINLIHVLESLTGDSAEQNLALLGSPWFGSGSLLDRVVRHEGKPDLTDHLQFAAWVRFLTRHGPALNDTKVSWFHAWMRAVRNLVLNTEVRAETFRRQLAGLDRLLEGSENILGFLANHQKENSGFYQRQLDEERLKASLILADHEWRSLLHEAEDHGYFRGQIGFLLEFSGAKASEGDQALSQDKFTAYWQMAQGMFDSFGLCKRPENDFLWERSLLAVGNYFLPDGGACRWSFLVNDRSSPASWKRLLRGDNIEKCGHLKKLWDWMATESLEQIAANPPEELWRHALCNSPAAWAYCRQRLIRFEERGENTPRVFLLSGQRRSAAYAELFTFCLWEQESLDTNRSRFAPLEFKKIVGDTGSDDDPYLRFELELGGKTHAFQFYCQHENDTGYSLWTTRDMEPSLGQILQTIGFVTETWGETEYQIKRQEPGEPLNGVTFLNDSIASEFKQQLTLHHS